MDKIDLFQLGNFRLNSGRDSQFKIEADAFSPSEWAALAYIAVQCVSPFGLALGVPRGGIVLAFHMNKYHTPGAGLLIVDDVYTTGGSMERYRDGREAQGIVVFARGPLAPWVNALFTINRNAEGL